MLRILVADSHPDCRESLVDLLALDGHLVAQAGSFEELHAHMATEEFDFALVDSWLDGASPFLLGRLARRRRGKLAIMVTHRDDAASAAFSCDGVAVLPKPFDHPRLLGVIECPMLRLLAICSAQGLRPQLRITDMTTPASLRMEGLGGQVARPEPGAHH